MRLREALASQTASCQQWEAQLSSAQVDPAQTVALDSECMAGINRGQTCLKNAVAAETTPCQQLEAQLALMQVASACRRPLQSRSHHTALLCVSCCHPLLCRSRAVFLLIIRESSPRRAFLKGGMRICHSDIRMRDLAECAGCSAGKGGGARGGEGAAEGGPGRRAGAAPGPGGPAGHPGCPAAEPAPVGGAPAPCTMRFGASPRLHMLPHMSRNPSERCTILLVQRPPQSSWHAVDAP